VIHHQSYAGIGIRKKYSSNHGRSQIIKYKIEQANNITNQSISTTSQIFLP